MFRDSQDILCAENAVDVAVLRRVLELEAQNHSGKLYTISISREYAPYAGWFTCYWIKAFDNPVDIFDTPMVTGQAALSFVDGHLQVAWRAGTDENIGFVYRPSEVMLWN